MTIGQVPGLAIPGLGEPGQVDFFEPGQIVPPFQVPTLNLQISFTDPFMTPVWVDITLFNAGPDPDGQAGSVKGGRDTDLNTVQPTTLSANLWDTDARFRIWNTDGPYFNHLSYADSLPTWPAATQLVTGSGPTGIGSWVASNATLALAPTGFQGLEVTPSSLAGVTANVSTKYAATHGVEYRATVSAVAVDTAQSIAATIGFYNSSNSLLSTATGTASTDQTGGWTTYQVSGTAPTSTSYALVGIAYTASDLNPHILSMAGFYRVATANDPGLVWGPGAQGPEDGPFLPRRPVRLLATWQNQQYPVYYGYLDTITPKWESELYAEMELNATDGMGLISTDFEGNQVFWPASIGAQPANANSPVLWRCGDAVGSAVAVPYNSADPTLSCSGTFGFSSPLLYDSTTSVDLSNNNSGGGMLRSSGQGPSAGGDTFEMMFRDSSASNGAGIISSGVLFEWPTGAANTSIRVFLDQDGVHLQSVIYGALPSEAIVTDRAICAADFFDGEFHYVGVVLPPNATGGTVTLVTDGYPLSLQMPSIVSTGSILATESWGSGDFCVGGFIINNTVPGFLGQVGNVAWYQGQQLTAAQLTTNAVNAMSLNAAELFTGDLVTQLLTTAGWPSTLINAEQGTVICQPMAAAVASTQFAFTGNTAGSTNPLAQTSTADVCNMAVSSEQGFFYQDNLGNLTFLQRYFFTEASFTNSKPQVLFSDNSRLAHSIPMVFISPESVVLQDATDTYTVFQVQRDNGAMQTYQNPNTYGRYGGMTFSGLTNLLMRNDTAALGCAQWLGLLFGYPLQRVSSLKLSSTQLNGQALPWMLGLNLWDVVNVDFSTRPGLDSGFFQTSVIEGFNHTWTPSRWDTEFQLSANELQGIQSNGPFILNGPTRGHLDESLLG